MAVDRMFITTTGIQVLASLLTLCLAAGSARAQHLNLIAPAVQPAGAERNAASTAPAPLTLTLHDALERAEQNDATFLSAVTDAELAREDRAQARATLLPAVGLRSEFLNTQGNGRIPTGRFVTNDGVHVYREWSVVHQDLSPSALTQITYRRSMATEAVARAREEIARRGLAVTVTRAYYALVDAERKYSTAQQAFEQAQHFLTISQDLERGGEVAHSDVIKFRLQANDAERGFEEARLAMESARLGLAVLLFRDFNQNFNVVDDLDLSPPLPSFSDVQAMAGRQNPDVRAALEALRAASFEVSAARQAFLPSFSLDLDYGIEANAIALRSVDSGNRELGPVPNLGYFLTATATLPVWDWGMLRSKLKQARLRRQLAQAQLSAAERQLLSNLYAFYGEAATARRELDTLRQSADLAAESLRLNTLRYQAGEATVLEVVDAQNTLTLARNAYDDGAVRYRVALANLQTLTGSF